MKVLRKLTPILGTSIAIMVVSLMVGLNVRQALTLLIFTITITTLIFFWHLKVPITLLGVSILISLGLIDIPHLIEATNLDVILFLINMMIITRFLENRHFFEYITSMILLKVGNNGFLLVVILMTLSAIFAALVGIVASALFMTASAIYIASRFKLNVVPLVLMVSFAVNIGSSATVIGNPSGILVAMKSGLTFSDFLKWATPISIINLILAIAISFKMFEKDIRVLNERLRERPVDYQTKEAAPRISERDLIVCWALFIGTVMGLFLSHQFEELMHLKKNTMLIGVSLFSAAITLIIERQRARELVERGVDWWTLIFFMMLFASVGALEHVGVTEFLAERLANVPGGKVMQFMTLTLLTGILSAFLDNVLAVATMAPIIKGLGEHGYDTYPFWWGIHFLGIFFGNLTIIASVANIIVVSMLERRGLGHISFMRWLKNGIIITVPTAILTMLLLIILQL